MLKLTCLFLVFIHTQISHGLIGDSRLETNMLQVIFGDVSNVKIIFVDRNEIFSKEKLRVGDDFQQNHVKTYLKSIFKDENIGDELIDDVTVRLNLGTAMVVPAEDNENKKRYCFVLTTDSSMSAEVKSKELIYWDRLKNTAEYRGRSPIKTLSKVELNLLSNLHETFHCLDPFYYVKNYTGGYNSEELAHKAESFAEVAAILFLAKYGYLNLAPTRGLYRTIGPFMWSKYSELFGKNLYEVNFGYIYSIYPSIYSAQGLIREGQIPQSIGDILNTAHEIVEDNSFDGVGNVAISNYQKNPVEFLTKILNSKSEGGEGFRKRMEEIEKIAIQYDETIKNAFFELFGEL